MDTIVDDDFTPIAENEPILPEQDVEFYECAKCGEWNILNKDPNNRRQNRARHLRLDDVTYGSLRRFATINGLKINKAIMLLLYNARTNNVNYLLSERQFVNKKKKDSNKGKSYKK